MTQTDNSEQFPPHNYEVTADGTRHFGYGYGDDNPCTATRNMLQPLAGNR